MNISFLPSTRLGKIASILIIAFILSIAVFFLLIGVFDQKGGDTFFSNPILTIPFLLAFACAATSFIISLIAIIGKRERSISVFLSMIIGLLITAYGAMELLFPH